MSLSDIDLISIPSQHDYEDGAFPLIVNGERFNGDLGAASDWLRQHLPDLETLLNQHGAVLFRGFPLTGIEDFDAFILAFDYPNFQYRDSLSNAVRVNKTERVFTANEAPPNVEIFMHHEMAQTPVFPSKLFFYCEKPAEQAGSTPVCRSDKLWQRIKADLPDFAASCEEKGLLYTNVMPDQDDAASGQGRSWRSTFFADTRETAEARMNELGYSWQWGENGTLRATTPNLPAVKTLADGTQVFFNQLIAGFKGWKDARNDPSKAITLGDGAPLAPDVMSRVCDMADEMSFDIPWQAGDVVLVDNFLVMHGRRPFSGTRKVLASLVAA